MIELYAITESPPRELPAVASGLTCVDAGDLVALCAPAQDDQALTPGVLWRHAEILDRLMDVCDLLPVRFGTRLPDEVAAARTLSERRAELSEALDRVRGAVELAVRIFSTAIDDERPREGAAYLRSRTARDHAAGAARELVHARLAPHARDVNEHEPQDPKELMRVAYLVDRDEVESFVREVTKLERAETGLRLLCTGPWPPYSFAG